MLTDTQKPHQTTMRFFLGSVRERLDRTSKRRFAMFNDVFRDGETRLKTCELARRLGVHTTTVDGWRKSGKLKTTRLGRTFYVGREDFESFVTLCNHPAEAELATV
jgi:excisionase family DNA binding protein